MAAGEGVTIRGDTWTHVEEAAHLARSDGAWLPQAGGKVLPGPPERTLRPPTGLWDSGPLSSERPHRPRAEPTAASRRGSRHGYAHRGARCPTAHPPGRHRLRPGVTYLRGLGALSRGWGCSWGWEAGTLSAAGPGSPLKAVPLGVTSCPYMGSRPLLRAVSCSTCSPPADKGLPMKTEEPCLPPRRFQKYHKDHVPNGVCK